MQSTSSSVWRTESDVAAQSTAAVIGVVAGLLLSGLAWNVTEPTTGVFAARVLGAALVVVGVVLLVARGRQVVSVDAGRRRIRLEGGSRFGASVREIRFDEITEVRVAELGDREGGTPSYHLVATLEGGREVPLFVGFFEGRHSRSVMEARRQRLLDFLRTPA